MKPIQPVPSVSYGFTMRLAYRNQIGAFARIVSTIGKHGRDLGAVDIVAPDAKMMTRDITVRARDVAHQEEVVAAVRRLPGVKVVNVSDRVFLLHLGGKISIQNKVPLTTRDTLSMAYTPGVARVCAAIAAEPRKAWQLTIKGNSVAVVSDGTAVLGLGDIGPEAALPVMEGKAMLFKEFAGIDAYPICLRTKDPEEIVAALRHLSVGFGGINLEDISAPRCFEIERKLQEVLSIPVFDDDQHGTAVVVLAALLNALRLSKQKLERLRIVVCGAGAAGAAVTQILLRGGARGPYCGDGAQRLPQPDQQCAGFPRHLSRGAECAGAADYRGDEAGGGAGHCRVHRAARAKSRIHRAQRFLPGGRRVRGGGGGGCGHRGGSRAAAEMMPCRVAGTKYSRL